MPGPFPTRKCFPNNLWCPGHPHWPRRCPRLMGGGRRGKTWRRNVFTPLSQSSSWPSRLRWDVCVGDGLSNRSLVPMHVILCTGVRGRMAACFSHSLHISRTWSFKSVSEIQPDFEGILFLLHASHLLLDRVFSGKNNAISVMSDSLLRISWSPFHLGQIRGRRL